MPEIDCLNAYCSLITGETAQKYKRRVEICETKIDVAKTLEEVNWLQVRYCNVPVKETNILQHKKWRSVKQRSRCTVSTESQLFHDVQEKP